jgi:hypothetical protein
MRNIRELLSMTSGSYVEKARAWSRVLEDREAARSGLTIREARPNAARKIGIPPGTLANLRNGRLKSIAAHVFDRLRAAVERELQAEMRALEHELQLLRQQGVDPRDIEIEAVVADLAKVRHALGMAPANGGAE